MCGIVNRCLVLLIIWPLAIIPWTAAWGDVVVLKNGNRIRGKVIRRDRIVVQIEVPYGRMTIPLRQVEEILAEGEEEYLRRTGEELLGRDPFSALEYLRQAQRRSPDSPRAREALVDGLIEAASREIERRRLDLADRLVEEADRTNPGDDAVRGLRDLAASLREERRSNEKAAREAMSSGDLTTAHQLFADLAAEYPGDLRRWRKPLARCALLLAHSSLKDGHHEEARRLYHQALDHDPDLLPFLELPLAYAEVRCVIPDLEKGEFRRARGRLRAALSLLPGEPALLYHLALACEGEGLLSEAARIYGDLAGPEGRSIDGARHLSRLRELAEEQLRKSAGGEAFTVDPRWRHAPSSPGVRESTHFILHHANRELGLVVLRALEQHLARIRADWYPGETPPPLRKKIEGRLHADRASFQSAVSPPPWSEGLTRVEQRYGVIVSVEIHFNAAAPQFLSSGLPHELGHALLPQRLGPGVSIPKWIEEGVATSREPEYKRRHYRSLVDEALAAGTLFSLEELLSRADYPEETRVPLFYAQAHSVVEFLKGSQGSRRLFPLLRGFIIDPPEEALRKGSRFDSLPRLERAWLRWLRRE